ncbi:sulfotransferase family 2 domain-containing protein [Marimonas arenosa]|uniref:Sulfotransferase family protein n=1 Tax=Marimonas arenosa TaxID=1795305 RepID=A0AAE3WGH2_9RHOB|nr:sulfotransferase family 2 domain-containing protein [Marimonas arenosa]MDQ2092093.1 sulfotransferase family protein [Marimonas arenosa]
MPLARLGNKLVFFAHIPKTGGTSVETYLRSKGRLALHHNRSGEWLKCSPQHMQAEVYTAMFGSDFWDHAFAVIRDPVARLQSEYRHRTRRAAARERDIAPFDIWAPRVLRRALDDPYLLDNHLRPQAEFVCEDTTLFRLEDGLEPVFDWIDEISGDATPMPRDWKRNLSHVDVGMSAETELLIRDFYADDERLLAGLM